MRIDKCKDCVKVGIVSGRGLCSSCYGHHYHRGTLDEFPRSTWKNSELIEEWHFCRSRGLSVREAAEKIGVKLPALRRAIERYALRQTPAVGPR